MIRFRLLNIVLMLLFSITAIAQNECQEEIDKAKKLYEEGVFREAEKKVKTILETCSLDKKKRSELLKLMASIYYEMDELELADEYISDFVKLNPNYVPNKKSDPYQFRLAIKNVKTWPRFSTGVRLGAPMGYAITKKIYRVLDRADYTQDYLIKPVFLANLEFSWNFNSIISVNAGAGMRTLKITHEVPMQDQLYFNYEELSSNLFTPLFVQLTIPINSKLSPSFYVGGEFEYYLGGKYNYYYTTEGSITNKLASYLDQKKDNVKIEPDQRNQYRYAALAGVRLAYKLKTYSIFADFRYIKEFDLYNNPETRYSDKDLYLENNYVLADVMLENMDISVGILFNFSYKAKSKY